MSAILRLAIPTPLRRFFDYLPPVDLSADQVNSLLPGIRLRVPFGHREVTGYLLEVRETSAAPAGSLKPALDILDDLPLIDPDLLQLCLWAAEYYHHPLGDVYSCLFPRRLREGGEHRPPGEPGWKLTARGKGLPQEALPRSPRQAQVIDMLRHTSIIEHSTFKAGGISGAVLRSLRDKNLIESCIVSERLYTPKCLHSLELKTEQATVLQAASTGDGFRCHLLEGVTGSGKTEIYLQLIADCLQQGRQALVLVPEIGLTPQTVTRFQQRFSANIAVLHSDLSDAQRYHAWEAARTGVAHIVIGTRSAVFTPLRAPGLIVVDEEHDTAYKQQDGFRYSARDVAVKRAQIHDIRILLGSATPSLESLHNAINGRYAHHRLTRRASSAGMPVIKAVDVRRQELHAGLSGDLLQAMRERLLLGQQVLLFLNRRGYAPTLRCHDCGWVAECRACDARLTVHRRQRRLRCHHCGGSSPLLLQCPQCHSARLLAAGLGTEQTEDALRARFSQWRIHRVDSDSMQGRDAMHTLVDDINRGDPCILIGTQMLTKGHHFPGVSLVAVIDADALLFSADFRGEERMAQLLTQVAGRAGRAEIPGLVLLQTHYPDHPSMLAMLHSSYAHQARSLLARRIENSMPPAGHLVILRTDCANTETGEQFLQSLRERGTPDLPADARVIGPLPSPMQRRAGKYRCQLLVCAQTRKSAQAAATRLVALAEELPARHGLDWSIDIDPQDLF